MAEAVCPSVCLFTRDGGAKAIPIWCETRVFRPQHASSAPSPPAPLAFSDTELMGNMKELEGQQPHSTVQARRPLATAPGLRQTGWT